MTRTECIHALPAEGFFWASPVRFGPKGEVLFAPCPWREGFFLDRATAWPLPGLFVPGIRVARRDAIVAHAEDSHGRRW